MADMLGSYNIVTTRTTVRFAFTTHAQTGAAVAPSTAFENADILIYKDGSATQRSSVSGITMTSPFDSITGLHHVSIDLTDDTDAGFWAAGHWYMVVLTPDTETVDSLAVVRVLAYFEIGPPPVNVTQLLGTAWLAPGTAGTPDVNTKLWGGSATPVTNINTIFNTDYATVYDATNKAFLAKLGNFAMGGSSLALTTGAIACSTITASGAVAFQSTFAVTTSTALGALSCTTLTASGAVALQSTVTVTGATSLAALSMTTLTASGAVAFQSTLGVTGTTTLAALTTTGTVTMNALTVSNNALISGTLTVSGTTSLAALTTSGTATFNALTVSNATTLTGAVSLGSTLTVTGATTLAALGMTTLTASGAVALQSSLTVTGATSLAALGMTTLTASGAVALQSTLIVTGATTLTGAVTASNASNDIRGITPNGAGTLTESYAADGAAPTHSQFQFMIWAAIHEFAISGVTITEKKLDKSTTAMTHTLDSATTPTSRTRAT